MDAAIAVGVAASEAGTHTCKGARVLQASHTEHAASRVTKKSNSRTHFCLCLSACGRAGGVCRLTVKMRLSVHPSVEKPLHSFTQKPTWPPVQSGPPPPVRVCMYVCACSVTCIQTFPTKNSGGPTHIHTDTHKWDRGRRSEEAS